MCFSIMLCVFLYYFKSGFIYEKNYFNIVGIENSYNYTYSMAVNKYGNPIKSTVKDDKETDLIYNGLILTFWTNDSNSTLMKVTVTGDWYKFGKKRICVGSSKKDVLKAYKNSKKSPDFGTNYVDGGTYVTF